MYSANNLTNIQELFELQVEMYEILDLQYCTYINM